MIYGYDFYTRFDFVSLHFLAQSIGLGLFEKEQINEIFKRNKSDN